ncbi:MAG: glycoside hydrolase family 32 protein [Fimbriimonadaceae bacterium]|nr:glycoside hydrolase family 32 protein [Fimbriimonadaceae bacterium]
MPDRHRPHAHYSPPHGWVNDPNGLVFDGRHYHLFAQHNPHGDTWGNMSWSHAVSEDLVHWQERPVALWCDEHDMVFSGSAIVLDDGRMLAAYTSHREGRQTQSLALSEDGDVWRRFEGNPVLDLGMADFRDPKLFRVPFSRSLRMAVALPTERTVRFYASDGDLANWEQTGEFTVEGAKGIWECPDLVELAGPDGPRWMLTVSNEGGCDAYVGEFDGATFRPDRPFAQRLDHGPDFYAFQTWNHARRPGLGVAWMSNWKYAHATPTNGWRGAMTIPRELSLAVDEGTLVVTQSVAEAVLCRRTRLFDLRNADARLIGGLFGVQDLSQGAVFLEASMQLADCPSVTLNLQFGDADTVPITLEGLKGTVRLDRRRSGPAIHPEFPGVYKGPLQTREGGVDLMVVIDRCSVEVLADGGRTTLTALVFPRSDRLSVSVEAPGGTCMAKSVAVSRIEAGDGAPGRKVFDLDA